MKTCARCKEQKTLDHFARAATAADGLQSYCRACKAVAARERYYRFRESEKERSRIAMAARRLADPEGVLEYQRQWRAEHPELERAASARQRAKPERKAYQEAYWREWKRRNPEQTRLISRRGQQARRARQAQVFVEQVDPLIVLDQGNGVCGICNEPVDPSDFHVDHIVPISRGGEHSYANTQPAHPFCNVSKGARLQVAA